MDRLKRKFLYTIQLFDNDEPVTIERFFKPVEIPHEPICFPKPETMQMEFHFHLIWLERYFDYVRCNRAVAKIYKDGELLNEVTYFDVRFICLDASENEDKLEDVLPYSGWFVHEGAKTTDIVHRDWFLNEGV